MIKFPFKFKEGELEIDFNWSDEVIPCKEVKITLGNKEVIISRDKFATLMAIFADDKQMEDIIQTEKTDFVSITRMLRIKTQKDLKAEESIVFPYTYWIPRTEYEKLKEEGEMVKLVEDSKKDLIKYVAENEAGKDIKKIWAEGRLTLEDLRL